MSAIAFSLRDYFSNKTCSDRNNRCYAHKKAAQLLAIAKIVGSVRTAHLLVSLGMRMK